MFRKLFEEMDDYTGAGGPTEEQIRHNNKVLLQALKDKGVDAEIVMTDLEGLTDEFEALQVAPRIFVGYDRWGFVGDDLNPGAQEEAGGLDQGSLEDAIEWVMKKVKKE
jgi:hypothetical protein